MRLTAVLLVMVSFATFSSAQDMASTYRQAAQNYMNAAAQCQNPAGAACMRSNAAYYQCIANQLGGGGACGNQPTCSTACTGNSATGAVSPRTGTIPTGDSKIDNINNAINLGVQILSMFHRSKSPDIPAPEPAVQPGNDGQPASPKDYEGDAASLLNDSNALLNSMNNGGASPSPNSAEFDSLFDSAQPDDSTSTVSSLLDSSASNDPTSTIAGLLTESSNDASTSGDGTQSQDPTPASMATIDREETTEAQSLGPNWASGFANLRDFALKELVPNPSDEVADRLGNKDPLKEGASGVIEGLLPASDESAVTLGSIVKDKFVDIASDKVADTLTDMKDQFACSGESSELGRRACMVLMAPSNLGRGLYEYSKILIDRTEKMMDQVQIDFGLAPTQ